MEEGNGGIEALNALCASHCRGDADIVVTVCGGTLLHDQLVEGIHVPLNQILIDGEAGPKTQPIGLTEMGQRVEEELGSGTQRVAFEGGNKIHEVGSGFSDESEKGRVPKHHGNLSLSKGVKEGNRKSKEGDQQCDTKGMGQTENEYLLEGNKISSESEQEEASKV